MEAQHLESRHVALHHHGVARVGEQGAHLVGSAVAEVRAPEAEAPIRVMLHPTLAEAVELRPKRVPAGPDMMDHLRDHGCHMTLDAEPRATVDDALGRVAEDDARAFPGDRSEEHTSELQSPDHLV